MTTSENEAIDEVVKILGIKLKSLTSSAKYKAKYEALYQKGEVYIQQIRSLPDPNVEEIKTLRHAMRDAYMLVLEYQDYKRGYEVLKTAEVNFKAYLKAARKQLSEQRAAAKERLGLQDEFIRLQTESVTARHLAEASADELMRLVSKEVLESNTQLNLKYGNAIRFYEAGVDSGNFESFLRDHKTAADDVAEIKQHINKLSAYKKSFEDAKSAYEETKKTWSKSLQKSRKSSKTKKEFATYVEIQSKLQTDETLRSELIADLQKRLCPVQVWLFDPVKQEQKAIQNLLQQIKDEYNQTVTQEREKIDTCQRQIDETELMLHQWMSKVGPGDLVDAYRSFELSQTLLETREFDQCSRQCQETEHLIKETTEIQSQSLDIIAASKAAGLQALERIPVEERSSLQEVNLFRFKIDLNAHEKLKELENLRQEMDALDIEILSIENKEEKEQTDLDLMQTKTNAKEQKRSQVTGLCEAICEIYLKAISEIQKKDSEAERAFLRMIRSQNVVENYTEEAIKFRKIKEEVLSAEDDYRLRLATPKVEASVHLEEFKKLTSKAKLKQYNDRLSFLQAAAAEYGIEFYPSIKSIGNKIDTIVSYIEQEPRNAGSGLNDLSDALRDISEFELQLKKRIQEASQIDDVLTLWDRNFLEYQNALNAFKAKLTFDVDLVEHAIAKYKKSESHYLESKTSILKSVRVDTIIFDFQECFKKMRNEIDEMQGLDFDTDMATIEEKAKISSLHEELDATYKSYSGILANLSITALGDAEKEGTIRNYSKMLGDLYRTGVNSDDLSEIQQISNSIDDLYVNIVALQSNINSSFDALKTEVDLALRNAKESLQNYRNAVKSHFSGLSGMFKSITKSDSGFRSLIPILEAELKNIEPMCSGEFTSALTEAKEQLVSVQNEITRAINCVNGQGDPSDQNITKLKATLKTKTTELQNAKALKDRNPPLYKQFSAELKTIHSAVGTELPEKTFLKINDWASKFNEASRFAAEEARDLDILLPKLEEYKKYVKGEKKKSLRDFPDYRAKLLSQISVVENLGKTPGSMNNAREAMRALDTAIERAKQPKMLTIDSENHQKSVENAHREAEHWAAEIEAFIVETLKPMNDFFNSKRNRVARIIDTKQVKEVKELLTLAKKAHKDGDYDMVRLQLNHAKSRAKFHMEFPDGGNVALKMEVGKIPAKWASVVKEYHAELNAIETALIAAVDTALQPEGMSAADKSSLKESFLELRSLFHNNSFDTYAAQRTSGRITKKEQRKLREIGLAIQREQTGRLNHPGLVILYKGKNPFQGVPQITKVNNLKKTLTDIERTILLAVDS